MKNFKLIQMSFDGAFVTDSTHETLESAQYTSANLGSKWYFYPWSIITKGQTVVETGGAFYNMKSGKCLLSEKLKGKRFKTAQKLFSKVSKLEDAQNVDSEEFELILLDYNA